MTSQNIEEMMASEDPEIKRLLGVEGDLGVMLGLDAEWAKRAIMAGGNYGEIFAAYDRRRHPPQHRARAERAVEGRRAAVLAALPLRLDGARRRPARPPSGAGRGRHRRPGPELRG